jgi:hypothetical protein
METIIFDLDGTLAHIDERKAKATKPDGKINWQVFFAPENIQMDKPNAAVILMFMALKNVGYNMVIFSGRDIVSRNETVVWLNQHGIFPDELKMRKTGTFTPDNILKKLWLEDLRKEGHHVICAYDDRDKVVKMWRDNGVPCMQVAEGNF